MQLEFGGQHMPIAAGELVIGSGPGANLRLAGPEVQARHAVLRLANSHPVIVPGSSNAVVAVNGTRIGGEPTPLMHGDRIQIGVHELRVADPIRGGETQVRSRSADPRPRQETAPPPPPVSRSGPVGRLVSLTDGREYNLDTVPFVFGRDAGAEVVIGSPDASRRHAEIASRPDGDFLVDLSTNGTYVNGSRIDGRRRLQPLDVIRIGAEEFRYYPPPATPATPPPGAEYRLSDTLIGLPSVGRPPAARRSGPALKPLAAFLVRRGPAKGERLAVIRPSVSIGRADHNDVRLADPSVSATHARLRLSEGVWILSDLESTNGTLVDGLPVTEETPLSPGTVIRLGEVDLLFEPHDEGVVHEAETVVTTAASAVAPRAEAVDRSELSRPTGTVVLVVGMILLVAALAVLAFLL